MQRRFGIIIVSITVIAAVLRTAGIFDDFWLDEVWTYSVARHVHTLPDILLSPGIHIDNNHPLNTLFMWLLGEQRLWWIYRLPALAAGIGSVIVTAVIATRRGQLQAIVATLLVGLSYPLIFYSSEARGYSMAVLFALLAFDALERYLARPGWKLAACFWPACALGVLSHLTFIHFYAGTLAWTFYRFARTRGKELSATSLLQLHLVPVALCIGLYVVFVRDLIVGGWAPEAFIDALAGSVAALVAMRWTPDADILIALIGVAILIWACLRLAKRGSDFWVFLIAAMVVSPFLLIGHQYLVLPPDKQMPVLPRYFLVPLPFFILAVSTALADVLRSRGRWLAVAAIVIFLALQLSETFRFLRVGRGSYSDAVMYMLAQTAPDQPITVISDHPLRTELVLAFYRRILPPGREIQIFDGTGRAATVFDHGPPEFAIRHLNLRNSPPAPAYSVLDTVYKLDREFPYYGLSGYSWYLYRRSDR